MEAVSDVVPDCRQRSTFAGSVQNVSLAMTRAVMELGLGLYLMVGVELAEWGLRRPDVTRTVAPSGSGKRYLLMVAIGPIWAMWVGLFMMAIAIDRGVLWGHYLITGGWIRFWTIIVMIAAILILNVTSPSIL